MANITCDLCEAEGAVLMQSNLGDGSTVAVGGACLLGFALGLAVGFSEGIPAEKSVEMMPTLSALIKNLAPELLPPAAKRARGKRSAPAEAPDGAEDGATVADPDGALSDEYDSLYTEGDASDLRERVAAGQQAGE